MKRRSFLKTGGLVAGAMLLTRQLPARPSGKQATRVRLLRHATLVVEMNGKKLLVDPMLSAKDALDPVPNAASQARIPMVDLPIGEADLKQLLDEADAVIVTHTHRDHWDSAAQQLIGKDKLVFCQPADEAKILTEGFTDLRPVQDEITWEEIRIIRTGGRHGTGEVGERMGTVSGFVLKHGKDSIYIAGDTIWCGEVKETIEKHQPEHIIVNGGGAQFLHGDPITMTVDDVMALCRFTKANVHVVHLETINHCYQRRPDFRSAIANNGFSKRAFVPDDGSWLMIG